MIMQIATPTNISGWWRNYLQLNHEKVFEYRMNNVEEHYWFADFRQGRISGFAGMKHETMDSAFIGPCLVHPEFRGRGLQRQFIKHREWMALRLGYTFALSFTLCHNYVSANNFIKSGYTIIEPWPGKSNTNNSLYWKKKLV